MLKTHWSVCQGVRLSILGIYLMTRLEMPWKRALEGLGRQTLFLHKDIFKDKGMLVPPQLT